jgi:hypothetical protein
MIDIVSGAEKPMISEGKISSQCYFMRKKDVQLINMVPVDVYETRNSLKPILKVYANCKKNTTQCSTNCAIIYLKE